MTDYPHKQALKFISKYLSLFVVGGFIILLVISGYIYIDGEARDVACHECFSAWNTEHGTHTWFAFSNEPIYNGEFVLCKDACTSQADLWFNDMWTYFDTIKGWCKK